MIGLKFRIWVKFFFTIQISVKKLLFHLNTPRKVLEMFKSQDDIH